jgi:hypothetical protein
MYFLFFIFVIMFIWWIPLFIPSLFSFHLCILNISYLIFSPRTFIKICPSAFHFQMILFPSDLPQKGGSSIPKCSSMMMMWWLVNNHSQQQNQGNRKFYFYSIFDWSEFIIVVIVHFLLLIPFYPVCYFNSTEACMLLRLRKKKLAIKLTFSLTLSQFPHTIKNCRRSSEFTCQIKS